MQKKKRPGLLETSVKTVKIMLCVLFVFIAFIFLYYGLINGSDDQSKESLRFIGSWTVTDGDGNVFTTDRSYMAKKTYEKPYEISSRLPLEVKENEYLFFVTRNDVAVYVNGVLRKDFVEKRDVNVPGGIVKRFYMMVPLTGADSGAEIKMVFTSTDRDEQIVPETFVCTRYRALRYLRMNGGMSFFLAAIVLIFSVVVIIISLVLRFLYKLKIAMTYGALGIFVIASWIITDSYLFPFFFGADHVSGTLNYLFCLMIPFAPAIYLNFVQRGRFKKSTSFVMILSAINIIVLSALHFTGIVPFYKVRTVGNVILVLMAVIAMAILIYDAKKGNISEYRHTFIGFFGFLVCCIFELTKLLIVDSTKESVSMVIGLGFLLTFVVIQQVDDLRKINLEKQRAIDVSEAKTRFLASMSHEIRTPINAILGMNEMILRESNDEAIGEYARSIKTSGKMLLMLVNDVLDFSKIEAGKLEISENHFLMSETVRDVISIIKERADEKSLELRTEITDEIPNELISDDVRIRQILVNLLSNAVKYTEKGTITLRLGGRYAGEGYELSLLVKDTGKGIREEEQATLFEAFTRADEKENVNVEGTGLGLAIVKSIVESMKGTLGVESKYGAGSEFWVKLPVKYVTSEPLRSDFMEKRPAAESAMDICDFTAPAAKVLAVDDNQSNLTIVKLFLKRTGMELDLCNSGNRAIELCRKKKYDLLLLDHMMPYPDGIETLNVIRSDASSLNRDTKAVVLTANAVAGSRQTYLNAGFEDYLTKPLDSKLLEQTVKKLLPEDKVTHVSEIEAKAAVASKSGNVSALRRKLSAIEGLDVEVALSHCGGEEEILAEIIGDVAAEGGQRAERMRKNLAENNVKDYEIDAHTIKSTMATIGLLTLSERARKHEFAAKEMNVEFIQGDAEDFIRAYVEVCKRLE